MKSLLLVAFGLALSLVLAEAALRILGVAFDASLFDDDPITGWRLRPNAEGWWVSEGHAYVRINSAGMHDREYPVEKPRDTVRIAVRGVSGRRRTELLSRVGTEAGRLRRVRRQAGRGHELRSAGLWNRAGASHLP